MEQKYCSGCQQLKNLAEFGWDRHSQKYRSRCKVCCKEYAQKYRVSGPQGKTEKIKIIVNLTEKQCSKCKQIKSINCFAERSGNRKGEYRTVCKDCDKAYRRNRHKEHPELGRSYSKSKWKRLKQDEGRYKAYKAKHYERMRVYRRLHPNFSSTWPQRRAKLFDLEELSYSELLEAQGGVCAICKKPETIKNQNGEVRSLAVDHDHSTGRVRGLLCFRCNVELGILENREFSSAAQAYLRVKEG